jgi:hypothetical protein
VNFDRAKPPPTPMPKLPVDPRPSPEGGGIDWPWVVFVVAYVTIPVGLAWYCATWKSGPCIGWVPAPPVYHFDGVQYVPEQRWRCVEWGSPR